MTGLRTLASAVAAAGLLVAGSAAAAAPANPQCKKACDRAYQQCSTAAKPYEVCMKAWGACKAKCSPTKTSATLQTPTPKRK